MDCSKLSDNHLYKLLSSKTSNRRLKDLLMAELDRRCLNLEIIETQLQQEDALFYDRNNIAGQKGLGLSPVKKLALLIIPFFLHFALLPIAGLDFVLFSYLLAKLSANNKSKQRKQFMFYYCAGWLLWPAIIVLLAKFFYFR